MGKTAILVDGGFYRKQANKLFGYKNPKDRAKELFEYCSRHLHQKKCGTGEDITMDLYRIFYYDCKPSDKLVYNPITNSMVDLGKTDLFTWSNSFFEELSKKRKLALRMGEVLDSGAGFELRKDALTKLCKKELSVDDLTEDNIVLSIQQKGVDMRIGLDIASLSHERIVDQIVLIAGDSDFVPAAKYARRAGIDFILDPMWNNIRPSLNLHIDGLCSQCKKPPKNVEDSLHVSHLSTTKAK